MNRALEHIRVLDFGRYIAGPHCSSLLAQQGAEVIRIERPEGGEDRYGQYAVGRDGVSATFLALNRNKKGLALDPTHPDARDPLARLIAGADIVVANVPPSAMRRMGIDYDSLRAIKPDIILVVIGGFDSSGPYAEHVGLDGIAQAMSGAAYLSGRDGVPSKAFPPWVDVLSGTYAAFGAMSALRHRDRTGEGQMVETDLLTAAVSAMSWIHTEQAALGIDRVADGSRTQSTAPGDVFRTRDGWVLIQTVGRFLFERLARLIGHEEWLGDPRFADDSARSAHRALLCDAVQAWVGTHDSREILDRMAKARIPCGPILSPQQLLDDPHVTATGLFQPLDYPTLDGPARVMDRVLRSSVARSSPMARPPQLGEHTVQILRDAGLDAAAIAARVASGAIRSGEL